MNKDLTIRKIRIFVAGSTKNKSTRNIVKKIVSDYNTKHFDMYMKPFFFYVYDYTSFYPAQRPNGQQEELYNAFIDAHADLAFFLVDGKIGKETKKEFIVASYAFKKERKPPHPDIHVLCKKGIDPNDIEVVKDYYLEFSNYDNLENIIINILDGFMEKTKLFYKADNDKYNKMVSEREIGFNLFIYKINHIL